MEKELQGLCWLGPDGSDKFSVERDCDQQQILDFCTDKPRHRSLYDLKDFCKFVNMRYYDMIMHVSAQTSAKFLEMLGQFKAKNCF